jgi:hypothetical protein
MACTLTSLSLQHGPWFDFTQFAFLPFGGWRHVREANSESPVAATTASSNEAWAEW